MHPTIVDLINYLQESPTAWNAVDSTRKRLLENGYIELDEKTPWKIELNKKYFTTRNNSSLIAFHMPSEHLSETRIIGAHTDSPGLKIKTNGSYTFKNINMLSTEIYGSPTIASFINKRLGIAGRIVTRKGKEEPKELTINITKPIGIIAPVAIHLERDQAEKLIINKQQHLPAIIGLGGEGKTRLTLEELLKKESGATFDELLGSELFLVPLDPPLILGHDESIISAGRLDNLLGSHATLIALLQQKNAHPSRLNMIALWDNEEVGSETPQGAASSFLVNVFDRIFEKFHFDHEKKQIFFQKSFLISNDVAHALHPNYAEMHEPNHQPLLSKGPAIKTNAQQRYATDAEGQAIIVAIAKDYEIPIQNYVHRTDKACGTTIGPIVATQLGLNTVDLGAPVLSMHSFPELGSLADHHHMINLLTRTLEK